MCWSLLFFRTDFLLFFIFIFSFNTCKEGERRNERMNEQINESNFMMWTCGYEFKLRQKGGEFYCFICFPRAIYSDSRAADMTKTWQMEDSPTLPVFKKNDRGQVPGSDKICYDNTNNLKWTTSQGTGQWLWVRVDKSERLGRMTFFLFLCNFPSSNSTLHPFFTQTTYKLSTSEKWRHSQKSEQGM